MKAKLDMRLEDKLKEFMYTGLGLEELEKELDYPIIRAVFNRIVEHVIYKIVERIPPEQLYMMLDLALKIQQKQPSQEQIERIFKCVESTL